MTSNSTAWLASAGLIAMIGCGDGGSGTTMGTGGATAASSSSSSSSSGGGSGGSSSSTTSSSTASGSGGGGPVYEPSGFSCSGANPSLADDIVPLTTQHCANGTGCHLAMNAASGVIDQLVNRIAQQCLDSRLTVDPGNPEKSYAIHKMTGKNICTGQTMPKDAPLLPNADIQKIYDWICNGAQNN